MLMMAIPDVEILVVR